MKTIVYMSLCLLCSAPILADRHVNLWQDDANLYVVLVKFNDLEPQGWVNGLSTDSAYTMEDFQRLFGEAGAPGFGTTDVHSVAETTEPLPTLYGSVKDYFEYLSGGEFTIVPKVLNPSNAQGYPMWLELDKPRSHYTAAGTSEHDRDIFEDAFAALKPAMQEWYPDTYMNYRIPYDRMPAKADDRANKIAFLYSGFTYGNGNGLHPRAWRRRSCYVTGERHGGDLNGHQSHPSGPDQSLRFSAIGIHAHEIGHLLPLSHGGGVFFDRDQNPYTGDSFLQTNVAANFMSWCAMQMVPAARMAPWCKEATRMRTTPARRTCTSSGHARHLTTPAT